MYIYISFYLNIFTEACVPVWEIILHLYFQILCHYSFICLDLSRRVQKRLPQNDRSFVALSSIYPLRSVFVFILLCNVKWITHRVYLLLMPSVYPVILEFSWPSLVIIYPRMFSCPLLIGIITTFNCLPPNFLCFSSVETHISLFKCQIHLWWTLYSIDWHITFHCYNEC